MLWLEGFGTTTMIINGGIECGTNPANTEASTNRQKYYRRFAADFGVDIAGEKLGQLNCTDLSSSLSYGFIRILW